METASEIDTLFTEKVKPFEDRIKELEEAEGTKEQEIDRLKQSIHRLSKILDDFRQNKVLISQK